ncbi:MAG: hypothetical protein ACK4UN_04135 [Limisphaerales bacterium]
MDATPKPKPPEPTEGAAIPQAETDRNPIPGYRVATMTLVPEQNLDLAILEAKADRKLMNAYLAIIAGTLLAIYFWLRWRE